jgi:photosystem II stability/assembly factor-like uncharacterized protein
MKYFFTILISIFSFHQLFAQWTNEDSGMPGTKTLIDMYASSNQVVWGAGVSQPSGAGVWSNDYCKTIDGGTTWTANTIPAGANFSMSNIFAFDANNAWVAMFNPTAGGGRIFHTTDGGTTWTQALTNGFTSASSFPNFIYFKDAQNGVVMGDPVGSDFEIYTTADGGATWTQVPGANITNAGGTEYGLTANYCALGNSVWFGTTTGRVFRSIDFGQHWTASTVTGSNYIISVSFKNNTTGIALDSLKKISATTDGGATWNTVATTGDYFSTSIRYVPGTSATYLGVGQDAAGTINGSAYSTDDGQTWNTLDIGVYHSAIAAFDGSTIWTGGYRDAAQAAVFPGIYKYSGTSFITSPTISLVYPNGGETLLTGQSYNITWTSTSIANVQLEYSIDNGSTWNTIIASTPNTNSYSWTVPVIAASTTCKIRVSDVAAASTNSVSTSTFEIMTVNGMASLPNQALIQIYPSPFETSFTVETGFPIQQWTLSDVQGNILKSGAKNTKETKVEISLQELGAGIYFFSTNNQVIKVIKK